jgi:hypothetical protein
MSDEALNLLKSIDGSLKELVRIARGKQPKPIAPDSDLDGKYGDPEIRFMPRDWTGPSFKGRHFSECPAELLDLLAESFDYLAGKAEQANERTNAGKPVSDYRRADAARARGWAKRIRDGKVPAAAGATSATAPGWAEGADEWR